MNASDTICHIARILSLSLAITALCNVALANNLDSLEEGQQAFNSGQYEKAFKSWWKQAIKGNTEAQVFVGLSHANGWGVKKDPDQAAVWYKMAAEKDNSSGQFLYGIYLINSKNEKVVADGIKWLHQSAKNGDESAFQFLKKANRKKWFSVSSQLLENLNQHSFGVDSSAKTALNSTSKTVVSSYQ